MSTLGVDKFVGLTFCTQAKHYLQEHGGSSTKGCTGNHLPSRSGGFPIDGAPIPRSSRLSPPAPPIKHTPTH